VVRLKNSTEETVEIVLEPGESIDITTLHETWSDGSLKDSLEIIVNPEEGSETVDRDVEDEIDATAGQLNAEALGVPRDDDKDVDWVSDALREPIKQETAEDLIRVIRHYVEDKTGEEAEIYVVGKNAKPGDVILLNYKGKSHTIDRESLAHDFFWFFIEKIQSEDDKDGGEPE